MLHIGHHQFSSVTQSCPTLCDPINHSVPGLPASHQLWEHDGICIQNIFCVIIYAVYKFSSELHSSQYIEEKSDQQGGYQCPEERISQLTL